MAVLKKIQDLDNATHPFTAGTELIEVEQGGVSKKGTWASIFGSGWWTVLKAAFSGFKAPDADHADEADLATEATLAADSTLAGGVDFVNGTVGVSGSQIVTGSGGTWTIPKGLYMMNADPGVRLEIDTSGGSGIWIGAGSPSGLVLSEGTNYRIKTTSPSAVTVYYRKLA